jgi:hypothetical protein
MPRKHTPKRDQLNSRLKKQSGEVFSTERVDPTLSGNYVMQLSLGEKRDILDAITQRYRSAETVTNSISNEINKAERQFNMLFSDETDEFADKASDDTKIYLGKTLEQIQIVDAHLDSLTSQLDPLASFSPELTGMYHPKEAFKRSKAKEAVTDFYLRKNGFKDEILPRWRMNFLKHPSAYIRVTYKQSKHAPDIKLDVIDRGTLYIDPSIQTANIKDAGWVIEKTLYTRRAVDENIRDGYWHVSDYDFDRMQSTIAAESDDTFQRLFGTYNRNTNAKHEQDEYIEIWHYFQSDQQGEEHAYGVVLGGIEGILVRWGGNPFPYKGIPYRGKSYIQHQSKIDGISLARQTRAIQEIANTFLNLRIDDVLENVKRRIFVNEAIVGDNTLTDYADNQKMIRLSEDFFKEFGASAGFNIKNYMFEQGSADSTQHLLNDMAYFEQQGKETTSINDVFRGANPQSGATLGQVQLQLNQAVGVFRPVFSKEMRIIEEVAEIVSEYFKDPDFFGPPRMLSFLGNNAYAEVIPTFQYDEEIGQTYGVASAEEMDVDTNIDVMNRADHIATRQLRQALEDQFMESMRHHPELMKNMATDINFSKMFTNRLGALGEDICSITFTEQEKQERAQQDAQAQQAARTQAIQDMKFQADASGYEEQLKAEAKAQAQIAVNAQTDNAKHDAAMEQMVVKMTTEHLNALDEQKRQHEQEIERMKIEGRLEKDSRVEGVGHGNNINR